MTERQRQTRVALLVSAHLLLGLSMAIVALFNTALQLTIWLAIAYMGLWVSQIVLLGIWLGLSTVRWWMKLAGLVSGIAWLTCFGVAPTPRPPAYVLLALFAITGVPVLVVAGSCALCRRWIASVERRDQWASRAATEDAQFTLKALLGLTGVIAALLALARFARWIDPEGTAGELGAIIALVIIIGLAALLAAVMLIWGAVGQGRVLVRVPTVLVGMALMGLLIPYMMGTPDSIRYFTWPALMVAVAIYAMGSLLVIRSCGYRLVINSQQVATSVADSDRAAQI